MKVARRRRALRMRSVLALVALVGLGIAILSQPLQRARLLLWLLDEPAQAYDQAVLAVPGVARDRVLAEALARVLADDRTPHDAALAAVATLACLRPETEGALATLRALAEDQRKPTVLRAASIRALGWLAHDRPAVAEVLLDLLEGGGLEELEVQVELRAALAFPVASRLPGIVDRLRRLAARARGGEGPWMLREPDPAVPEAQLGLVVVLEAIACSEPVESASTLGPLAAQLAELIVDPDLPMPMRRVSAQALARLGERGAAAAPLLAAAVAGAFDRLERDPGLAQLIRASLELPAWTAIPSRSMPTAEAALALGELENLYSCVEGLGEAARGMAPAVADRLCEPGEHPWSPPLIGIYAGIETSAADAMPVLRSLMASGVPLHALPAAGEALRLQADDAAAMEISFQAIGEGQRWGSYKLRDWKTLSPFRGPEAIGGRGAHTFYITRDSTFPFHAVPLSLLHDIAPSTPWLADCDPRRSIWQCRGVGEGLLGAPDGAELPLLLGFLQEDVLFSDVVFERLRTLGAAAAPASEALLEYIHRIRRWELSLGALMVLAAIDPDDERVTAELRRIIAMQADDDFVGYIAALLCLDAGAARAVAESHMLEDLRANVAGSARLPPYHSLANLAWRAHREGRKLEIGSALAVVARAMDDSETATAFSAGRAMAALQPAHPGLAAWAARMLKLAGTDEDFFPGDAAGRRHRQLLAAVSEVAPQPEQSAALLWQLWHQPRDSTVYVPISSNPALHWDRPWRLAALIRAVEGRPLPPAAIRDPAADPW